MKKTNLSFVLALLALQAGGCIIYQGEQKEDNLCYKIENGELVPYYQAENSKRYTAFAPVLNKFPTWAQILENNWTVEVIQAPESMANEGVEGLGLSEIKACNDAAVKAFAEKYNAALAGLSVTEMAEVVESPEPSGKKSKKQPAAEEPEPVAPVEPPVAQS